MNKLRDKYQVCIIGGGPVGLFLAIALRQRDIDCVVLEKRTEPTTHSRSLGIHPVSLELMQEIGLADDFIQRGIKITEGVAWGDNKKIGTLSFENCPGPYPFVLSLPQYKTERLLEDKLYEIDPGCLSRGIELVDLEETESSVNLTLSNKKKTKKVNCDLLIGSDGKNSFVRKAAGFEFLGRRYPDTYVMGDFSDNTDLGSTAAIFLHSAGLIESFPLGTNRRRWVIKTDNFRNDLDRAVLERLVRKRVGHELQDTENFMLSSFGVQGFVATPMARNRIFLAGDSAHIVSPIGGQGMNLGWLDAWEIVQHSEKILRDKAEVSYQANLYNKERSKTAKKALKRAEVNMLLGRKTRFPYPKNGLVWLMLNTPLERLMARIFTMRGLQSWPF
ncbi:FAD-dependent monooxygenase [Aliifodinibius sp. S!AR15-10]|uniref:FAD-dependent oxidoreductase n=1 Tax=Aliifodinibius sp. S!AR15-10 TaxID=2950437 RepID=UPI0028563519|nr:NAD(P)/FAD-dependent oxidoreductase [Aliifodinibius sp. S!AR15-10]MDR8394112.1 FAD-dependent monooxygenase [Aliifodinibius sp. S!AR15-10]